MKVILMMHLAPPVPLVMTVCRKKPQGTVTPDSFTHGTSAQRMYWFKKGYTTGDISQGDTFNDPSLN